MDLPTILARTAYDAAEIEPRFRRVYNAVIAGDGAIADGMFQRISTTDLRLLFRLYDEHFFTGALESSSRESGHPVVFRLSGRMTKAGGKTKYTKQRANGGLKPGSPIEIAISTTLLWQTFEDVERTVEVNGIECLDRLEALQRIFEHELIHTVEVLAWGDSNCARERFQSLARRFFGHTAVTHDLVTQAERAATRYDIRVGDRVAFEFEGRRYAGIVNRVTKRATVLIEDPAGRPYTDGKRYRKCYVPLALLQRL